MNFTFDMGFGSHWNCHWNRHRFLTTSHFCAWPW